jgi:hypothetical protein
MTRLAYRLVMWLGRPWRPYWRVDVVGDIPDTPKPFVLYVVGEDGHQWYAAMRCPCGCGEVLHMGLNPSTSPCWTLTRFWNGAATLTPSVWRRVGCRSHFYLVEGQIRWV